MKVAHSWPQWSHRTLLQLSISVGAIALITCGGDGGPVAPPLPPSMSALNGAATQTAVVGAPVPVRPSVRIVDGSGKAVAGAPVTFAVVTGAGSLSGASQTTNAEGVAELGGWTLGTTAGPQSVGATSTRVPGGWIVFAVNSTPGPDAVLAVIATLPASVQAGTPIAPGLAVEVRDQFGNRTTSTAPVTLSLATNPTQATLAGTSTVAAVDGRAAFPDLSVATAGEGYTLVARSGAMASPPTAAFAVTPGAPAALVFETQPQRGVAGTPLTPAPRVRIRDAHGNTVNTTAEVTLAFGVNPANGTLSGTASRGAAGGIVDFPGLSVNRAAAGYTLAAASAGLATTMSDTFSVAPGQPASIQSVAGTSQSVLAGTEVPVRPAVRVTDAFENAVPGALVAFTPAPGAGSVTTPTVATGADGIAAVGAWLLGGDPGPQVLTASGSGFNASAQFVASALPNGRIVGNVTPSNSAFNAAVVRASMFADLRTAPDATAAMTASRTPRGDTRGQNASAAPAGGPSLPSGQTTRKSAMLARSGLHSLTGNVPAPRVDGKPPFVPNELLVQFRPGVLQRAGIGRGETRFADGARRADAAMRAHMVARQDARLQALGTDESVVVTGSLPILSMARVRIPAGEDVDAVARELAKDPEILSVSRPTWVYAMGDGRNAPTPPSHGVIRASAPGIRATDPLTRRQWWHYDLMNLPRAWSVTTGAPVVVAVVDDGIRFDHPDIAASLTNDGYDFASDFPVPLCAGGHVWNAGDGNGPDADPTIPGAYEMSSGCVTGISQTGGHGLHVAGTIGAQANNGMGGTGVSWAVRIRPVRVFGSAGGALSTDIAAGILYAAGFPVVVNGVTVQAASRAAVINLSLGGPADDPAQRAAVDSAIAAGSLVVVAAGNANTDAPMYPAAYPGVLTVAAIGPTAERASYSNYASAALGSKIDLAAPGGDLNRFGQTAGVMSTQWNFATNTPIWTWLQGTSMAAPHVAGVAALILSREPGLTGAQLKARLMSTATDIGPAGYDQAYGAGLVNAWRAVAPTATVQLQSSVLLYSATTGSIVAKMAAGTAGAFAFTGLGNGTYWVFGGQDEDGDGRTGVPGRRWGALGLPSSPLNVNVAGAGTYGGSFFAGLPIETEPNDDGPQANTLVVGGYLAGSLSSGAVDVFRLVVPTQALYTFETEAILGSCGFALEEDTMLELFTGTGAPLAWHDDIGGENYCSRLTQTLAPGTYFLRVSGFVGGRYQLSARAGS